MTQFYGLVLAGILVFMAVMTIRWQFVLVAQVKKDTTMPSEDRRYLTKRARRRVLNGIFLLALGGMLSWTYLSGTEARAGELSKRNDPSRENPEIPRIPFDEEERAFLKFYGTFWILFLLLLFVVFTMAIMDFWATRRYAVSELTQEHYAMKGAAPDVPRLQRTLVRFERSPR